MRLALAWLSLLLELLFAGPKFANTQQNRNRWTLRIAITETEAKFPPRVDRIGRGFSGGLHAKSKYALYNKNVNGFVWMFRSVGFINLFEYDHAMKSSLSVLCVAVVLFRFDFCFSFYYWAFISPALIARCCRLSLVRSGPINNNNK